MSGKLRSTAVIVSAGVGLFAGHALYSGNAKFYSEVAMPALQTVLSPEASHNFAIAAAKYGIYPRINATTPQNLRITTLGYNFDNPVGLAAGFDKHCEAIHGLLGFGFGFIEVGAVTPEPQPGNDKPRVFRLAEDRAIINRYGFNSVGHDAAYANFKEWFDENGPDSSRGKVGINLGKNKHKQDAVDDYVKGVEVFGPVADFLVINVSSPNTPGLRQLQGQQELKLILDRVVDAREKLEQKPPILVKISPDLSEKDCIDIAAVVGSKQSGVDGLIVSNSTVTRPEYLQSESRGETGGLSGAPLRDMSTRMIQQMYRLTAGRMCIIGVGGVFTGQDALDKIKAGASLIQLYTALAYNGPPVIQTIKTELAQLLEKEGFESVSDAIGVDVRGRSPEEHQKSHKES